MKELQRKAKKETTLVMKLPLHVWNATKGTVNAISAVNFGANLIFSLLEKLNKC